MVVAPAHAAVLMSDDFNIYSNGDLDGQGGWVCHSSCSTGFPLNVHSGEVLVKQAGSNRKDVNKSFGAQAADATTYACFTFRVPALPAPVATDEYFAHFWATSNQFRSRVVIGPPPAGGGDFGLGINATSLSAPSPNVWWPAGLSYDTVYRVVHSYDAATGDSHLWLNPVAVTSASISSPNPDPLDLNNRDSAGTLVEAYAWRQSSEVFTAITDNLSVGEEFEDCYGPTQTDQTTWGQVKSTYR
jgi:hypothetical protein